MTADDDDWMPNYAKANSPVQLPGGVSVIRYIRARTDEVADGWRVEAWMENTAAGPRCVDLRIVASADHPITSHGLRRVPVGQLMRFVEDNQPIAQDSWSVAGRADRAAYRRARRQQEAKGRRRVTDDDLRRTTEVYRAAVKAKEPATAAVQRELGLTSRGQAAKWVVRARQAGFLGPAPARRQQGEASPPDDTDDMSKERRR